MLLEPGAKVIADQSAKTVKSLPDCAEAWFFVIVELPVQAESIKTRESKTGKIFLFIFLH
jgi:chloramphenicol 3-O-phosphotransferase